MHQNSVHENKFNVPHFTRQQRKRSLDSTVYEKFVPDRIESFDEKNKAVVKNSPNHMKQEHEVYVQECNICLKTITNSSHLCDECEKREKSFFKKQQKIMHQKSIHENRSNVLYFTRQQRKSSLDSSVYKKFDPDWIESFEKNKAVVKNSPNHMKREHEKVCGLECNICQKKITNSSHPCVCHDLNHSF